MMIMLILESGVEKEKRNMFRDDRKGRYLK